MEVKYNSKKLRFECKDNDLWYPLTIGHEEEAMKAPFRIDRYRIEVSLACNLKCKYCVVHMNNVKQMNTIMSIETARLIVDKYNKEVGKNGSVFIMGGEPLTNIPVVKYIIENSKGASIIFTNALLLDDDLIDFFYKHGTYILTSLDGYSLMQNEKRFWPKGEQIYNKVIGNIKNAINRGCKVGVSCLLHNGNIKDAGDIAEYFVKELGARAMSFAYPHRTMGNSEEDNFNFEEYLESLIKVYNVAKSCAVYVDQIGKIMSNIVYGRKRFLGCKAGTTQRTFYPDGHETICTKIDTQNGFSIDDYINKLPYYNEECTKCIAHGLCCGECPWDFLVATKKGIGPHKRICEFYKGFVEYIVDDIKCHLSTAKTIGEAKLLLEKYYIPLTKNYTY